MPEKHTTKLYIPFDVTKTDDEQRLVYGYCSSEALDSQGEIIKRDAIREAFEDYMKFANVREMHEPSAVGVTKEYTHDDKGTYIVVKVVDDRAWKFVKEGVYKGFSIGGKIIKKFENIITKIKLYEISLVDRPANPDALIEAYKIWNGDEVESPETVVANTHTTMNENETKETTEEGTAPAQPSGHDGGAEEEATQEQTTEGEATPPAKPDTEEKPEAEEKPAAGEKAAKPELKKDTKGVLAAADLLGHLDYVVDAFKYWGKNVSQLEAIRKEIMAMVKSEAEELDDEEDGEKSSHIQDLSKHISTTMQKAADEIKAAFASSLSKVESDVATLKEDVAAIKSTKISPRPKAATAVEKGFETSPAGDSKTLSEKRGELKRVEQEIDDFNKSWGAKLEQDPTAALKLQEQAEKLHAKYRQTQRDINDLLMGAAA